MTEDYEEQEVNLISLMFCVLHRYRAIIITALMCAAIGAGLAYYQNWQNGKDTSVAQKYETDMAKYQEAKLKHDTNVQNYRNQIQSNEKSQATTKQNIENAEEYIASSSYYGIDPYNVYTASAHYL